MKQNYHYQTIGRALDYIRDHVDEQPSLETIAAATGLSPFHFQRVFREWVGLTPKQYVQHLTLANAKSALLGRVGTLETAQSVGLSGTGRLYDLVMKWEAVTPGALANGGADLVFDYGFGETQFGRAIFIAHEGRLAALGFHAGRPDAVILADFRARWPRAGFREAPGAVANFASTINDNRGELSMRVFGTEFQIAVWRALMAIPEGAFATYSDIANAIDRPKATRAVGTAIGMNPVSWIIPCHRAIRKSGALGGYHWGLPVKEAMIAYEAAKSEG